MLTPETMRERRRSSNPTRSVWRVMLSPSPSPVLSARKAMRGSRILVLGVAYKANIDDMRESPAIKIANLLRKRDAELVYHDSYVPEFIVDGVSVPSVELTEEEVAKADAVVVVTDHSNVDYHLVVRSAKLVLDTRNVLKAFDDNHVERL